MEKYIYLDREKAKEGISLVYKVSETKIDEYKEYFEGNVVEFYGEDLPHFITYLDETNTVREATEKEKVVRVNRVLSPGEIIQNGEIVIYDIYSQKNVEGEIVDKTRQDFITENILTLESEKTKAREERDKQLKSLDLYDKAVLRGDIVEDEQNKQVRDNFRTEWLLVPNDYSDINIPIEDFYPVIPEFIKYFA